MASDLFRSLEEFINRRRDPVVRERVSKFVARAKEKGWVTDEAVLDVGGGPVSHSEGRPEWTPIHAFFAPVGYRSLFEQEVLFLLNEGFDYEGILKMPVPIRKKLIDKKLELRTGKKRVSEEPDIPAALLEQIRLATKMTRESRNVASSDDSQTRQGAEIGA